MVKRSSLLYPDQNKRFEALTGDETKIQEKHLETSFNGKASAKQYKTRGTFTTLDGSMQSCPAIPFFVTKRPSLKLKTWF